MINERLMRAIAVAVAVMATAASCGDGENTPSVDTSSPATAETTAPTTPAGMPRILFFDRDVALQASAAGKSMIQQVQQLKTQVERELQAEGQRLQADARAFQQQQAILAAGVKAQRQRDLTNREAALRRKAQQRTEQIQYGFRLALEEFSKQMQPVLEQIMTERQANLLLDRRLVLMAPPKNMEQYDATPLAVQRLDAKVRTIPVRLVTPPAQPAQGAAPRPAAPSPAGQ
jgi:Skp family chaperone for outer membrane proteins